MKEFWFWATIVAIAIAAPILFKLAAAQSWAPAGVKKLASV